MLDFLRETGYRNPAIFALDYSLVPYKHYPFQVNEAIAGLEYVIKAVGGDASRVCLGADSAGATISLSMFLELAQRRRQSNQVRTAMMRSVAGACAIRSGTVKTTIPNRPHLAVLISPWTNLIRPDLHRNTTTDYLDAPTLWLRATQYAGNTDVMSSPLNPGECADDALWREAAPAAGYHVLFSSDEVMVGDIRDFIASQREYGVAVRTSETSGQPHAWAVAAMFLATSIEDRFKGLRDFTNAVSTYIPVIVDK